MIREMTPSFLGRRICKQELLAFRDTMATLLGLDFQFDQRAVHCNHGIPIIRAQSLRFQMRIPSNNNPNESIDEVLHHI